MQSKNNAAVDMKIGLRVDPAEKGTTHGRRFLVIQDRVGVIPKTYLKAIRESSGGCTADDDFHRILEESFCAVQEIAIPQFWGVHDFLSIWKRKPHRRIVL